MDDPTPPWDSYRSFLALLREGSLSGAARALGLTQPTIGRHLDALEQGLGAPLFLRSQQGVRPTDAAIAVRPYAEALEAAAEALVRAAANQRDIRGTVRITASEVVGAEVLPPIIAALQREHPDLAIELVLSNRMEDLFRRDADIAVRMARPTQQALVARRVGVVALGLFAHRDYLARRATPESMDDLRRHALIGFDKRTAFIRGLQESGVPLDRDMFSLRADSDLAQLAAIRTGCGIGVCQIGLARRDERLIRVLRDQFEIDLETWIVMHEDLRASPRCRAAFDALVAGVGDYVRTAGAPAERAD